MELRFRTVDVFTTVRFGGNPLAIVFDAAGLSGDAMQAIAREFNLSETTFVLPPRDAANTASVRIFTPQRELPFAGHPTVGTAVVLAEEAERESGSFPGEVRLEEGVGLLPVRTGRDANGVLHGTFTNAVLPQVDGVAPAPPVLARALGVEVDAIGFEGHTAGIVNAGNRFVFVPVGSVEALGRCRPVQPGWDEALAGTGAFAMYLYTPAAPKRDGVFRARLFAPEAGVPEDPATGSAAAAFPGQLARAGAIPGGSSRWLIEQGHEMGRPSQIRVEVEAEGGSITAVRVGGNVVAVSSGTITV